ncbi:hemagglutinin/amebocyte aggregation factor-like [Lineus longissimus]|uniref:hemagglutinin/amebocyte aggregation factor-like n=1 Tax=Lineus longissimus TaxID=88925 RepID=UPI002B4F6C26
MLVVLLTTALFAAASGATLYQTPYDDPWERECPQGQLITRLESSHDNGREDRVWTITCSTNGRIKTGDRWSRDWTTYDQPLRHECGNSEVLAGMRGQHDNGKEDRRWQFMCRPISGPLINCRWTGFWINDWDDHMDYSIPATYVLNGLYSEHNNGKEDRRWKVRVCQLGQS